MQNQLRVRLRKDLNAVLVYDTHRGMLLDEVTDFAFHQLDYCQLAPSTVYGQVLNVVSFWAHCASVGIDPVSADDTTLKQFRDAELKLVLCNPASKGDERIARGTVNQKLLCVYCWFLWLRRTKRVPDHAVGPNGTQIDCSIGVGSSGDRPSTRAYPLLFRVTTAGDRGLRKHLLSDQDRDDVLDTIMASDQCLYVRQRNALLLDIGLETGLRRGSINSFQVDQFERSLIGPDTGPTILIRPKRQKFNRGITYELPTSLFLRICDFIDGPRSQLLVDKQRTRPPRGLFLSARDCNPLEDGTITAMFSKLMRSIGAQKGTAFHVLRIRFVNVQINLELKERLALGLDTSTASVAAAVAIKVGHRNARYLEPYVLVAQDRLGCQISSRDEKRLREAEAQVAEHARVIADLRAENERLRTAYAATSHSEAEEQSRQVSPVL
jgi:hypothetical protein